MEEEQGGWVWRQVAPLFQWLGRQFETIASWILDKLIDLLLVFADLVVGALDWFFGLVSDVMPDSLDVTFDALSPMFGAMRAWFPVEYWAALMASLFAVQGTVVGFKFFLKLKQLVNPFG